MREGGLRTTIRITLVLNENGDVFGNCVADHFDWQTENDLKIPENLEID